MDTQTQPDPQGSENTRKNKPRDKKKMIIRLIIGAVLGAAAGFAYYKFVGCRSGSCPITSNPWISSIYGSAMGMLIAWR